MDCYPVCIPTLCRYEHFKRCVESLLACPESKNTELVVSVDYPLNDNHKEGRQRILDYITKLTGFGSIKLFVQKKNLGARDNWVFVREYALDKYGAAILTEDDNCFAPCFLNYMNKALDYYWNDERVMTITGYSPVGFEKINEPVYFSYSLCAWGIGWWKHKKYDDDSAVSYYTKILNSTRTSLKLFVNLPSALGGLLNMVRSGERLGDYGLGAQNVLNKKYQLRPRLTLVINYGQDGSGLHSRVNNAFHQQELQRGFPFGDEFGCDFKRVTITQNKFVRRYLFWRYGGVGKYHITPQIKLLVKYILYRFKVYR